MATEHANQTRTGRRKESVARVRLMPGSGKHTINDRTVVARVRGGGLTGQAGALRLAVARALAREDESLRAVLGRAGLLTRDPRMKERKKYGQPGARKRFQFSKR